MKQLTNEVFAQVRGALEQADIYLEEGSQSHSINRLAIAALDAAQPVQVNAMLVEALEANHKWHQDYDDHGGYPESDLCEQNEAAITAAKQAQPEPVTYTPPKIIDPDAPHPCFN